MRTRIPLFVLASILASFYLVVVFLALHPNVSREYKAYYIDRTSSDWQPTRYAATADQGISFGTQGLPSFVQYLYGFSFREPWGRWTDARRGATAGLVLSKGLSGSVCVQMKAQPANSQIGKLITVMFGDQEQRLALKGGTFSQYSLEFFESKPADTLEFRFEGAVPAENAIDHKNPDPRRLGLALMYVRFISGSCKADHPEVGKARIQAGREARPPTERPQYLDQR